MPTKVQFIREIHDKIQINKRKKKHWKGVRKIQDIKKTKTLKECKTTDKKQILNEIWLIMNYNLKW
jgi:hypothetical protein